MTQGRDEELLREGFRRLRSETESGPQVPDFQAMMTAAKAEADAQPTLTLERGGGAERRDRRRILVLGGWVSAAAAAAVAGLLLFGGQPDADAEFERLVAAYSADLASGTYSSPTSALLDVPGMGLTRSLPSIGGSLRGLDPDAPPPESTPDGRDS